MSRRALTKTIAIASVFTLVINGGVRAAATIGETRVVPREAEPVAALDMLKLAYRRPSIIPFPAVNPYSPEKAMLGRALFYDTRLSGNGSMSCVSCHNPGFGHADWRARQPLALSRKSPGVINNAWGQSFMWDGRAETLEEQALVPIQSPSEMNKPLDHLVRELEGVPGYRKLFADAFPGQGVVPDTISEAIATYERTIVSAIAPFDRWIEGDAGAISASARRGFDLFNAKAGCASCHGGWRFTDDGFHDIGLPDDDKGRGEHFPLIVKMGHAFKTPGLREVALRAPYMHDGSLPTLNAVVAHYNHGGAGRASQSELVTPRGLTTLEQADIVSFLGSLTAPVTSNVTPALPR